MDYITTQQAAIKWSISDRRVRMLCAAGKIPGTLIEGKTYKLPANAKKPVDGRVKADNSARYLKWHNDIVGIIDSTNSVKFTAADYNEVVSIYTKCEPNWTPEQYNEFLSERIISRDRRDIERILFRCGLSHYNVLQIADITRGIHPKDLLWIAHSKDEELDTVITTVFESVFNRKTDLVGESIDTPEGYNIKRYGAFEGNYGIYKQRISPLATDVESEIAVYLLAEKMGIRCCPATRTDKDTVFSAFMYDFSKEYIVHFRRLFDGARSNNEYRNLISIRPQYRDEIAKMILLDFITRQDDRHLSNIAIKMTAKGESFYPLYDNGRSLFYEDTEEMVQQAVIDPAKHATTFGYSGTYWDYIKEIASTRTDMKTLLNLDISKDEVATILIKSGFKSYRLDGSLEWIVKAIEMIDAL